MDIREMRHEVNSLLSKLRDEDAPPSRQECDRIDRRLEKLREMIRFENYKTESRYGPDPAFDTLEERDSVYEE